MLNLDDEKRRPQTRRIIKKFNKTNVTQPEKEDEFRMIKTLGFEVLPKQAGNWISI